MVAPERDEGILTGGDPAIGDDTQAASTLPTLSITRLHVCNRQVSTLKNFSHVEEQRSVPGFVKELVCFNEFRVF